MGHSLSADKRERQNVKRNRRNRTNMVALRRTMKRIGTEITTGKDPKATLSLAFKALDSAVRKNTIPKKRADRKKSRIALALQKAKNAGTAAPTAQK